MRAIANGSDYKTPATIDDPQVLKDVEAVIHAHIKEFTN